ncbi:hypothetical protein HZS_2958 [Henneguya salminicola]|nr:hypothetical protein HZS_2958 [Henneguya salminicola]
MTRGSTLNNDISARIIEKKQWPKIAEVFDHNRRTVHNFVKRYLLTGEIENKPRMTRTQKKLKAAKEMKIKG